MHPLTRQWADELARFVADHRAARPPRAVPMVAAVSAAHERILTDHLAGWLAHDLPAVRRQREALAAGGDVDPDPVILCMTSDWGLAATARAVAHCPPGTVLALTELEFREWSKRHPDEGHRHHVIHWSWVKLGLPPARQAEFAHLGAPADAILWLHRHGTSGAGARDGLTCGVWHWDGSAATLLTASAAESLPGA